MRTSGKFELLDRILPKLFATGHKVSHLSFLQSLSSLTAVSGLDFLPNDGNYDTHCRLLRLSRMEVLPTRR